MNACQVLRDWLAHSRCYINVSEKEEQELRRRRRKLRAGSEDFAIDWGMKRC